MDNRQKLHQMIDSISSEGTLSYLETFIRLFIEKFVVERCTIFGGSFNNRE